jgi:hypothetical protein
VGRSRLRRSVPRSSDSFTTLPYALAHDRWAGGVTTVDGRWGKTPCCSLRGWVHAEYMPGGPGPSPFGLGVPVALVVAERLVHVAQNFTRLRVGHKFPVAVVAPIHDLEQAHEPAPFG